jgi:hypothetical protein
MPRYFFDMTDGKPYRDGIGQELEDDRAAWREALRVARDIEDLLAPVEIGCYKSVGTWLCSGLTLGASG